MNCTATIRDPGPPLLPPSLPHTNQRALQPLRRRARLTRPDRMPARPGRRSRFCGTPWTRLSLLSLRCRLPTFLCRRRWTSWWVRSCTWIADSRARYLRSAPDLVPIPLSSLGSPEPQKAEQLVEAPTLVSLVEVFEQPVDIPVRAWGGTVGRLQGFLPDQSSSSVEQIADIPVPHHGIYGGFQRFSPRTEFNSSRRAIR